MSEALQCMTEATRSKHPRTPAQLEALRHARQKAQQVRAQNADLRRKQAEIDKAATENAKRQKVERIEREYAALKGGCQESTEVDQKSMKKRWMWSGNDLTQSAVALLSWKTRSPRMT